MNKQKIEEAFTLLKQAIEDESEEPVAVNLALTKREVQVLVQVARANVSVPNVVEDFSRQVRASEVKALLSKISDVVDPVR
jgi:hypothetical protein